MDDQKQKSDIPDRETADRETLRRALSGDPEAWKELWEWMLPMIGRRAFLTTQRYAWLDQNDIQQELCLFAPKILRAFKFSYVNPLRKYVYFRLVYAAKDVLRREDPLGVSWPQKGKGPYPEWHRLSDLAEKWDTEGREKSPDQILEQIEESTNPCTENHYQIHRQKRLKGPSTVKSWLRQTKRKKRNRHVELEAVSPDNSTATPVETSEQVTDKPKRRGRKKQPEARRFSRAKKKKKVRPKSESLISVATRFVEMAGGARKAIKILDLFK